MGWWDSMISVFAKKPNKKKNHFISIPSGRGWFAGRNQELISSSGSRNLTVSIPPKSLIVSGVDLAQDLMVTIRQSARISAGGHAATLTIADLNAPTVPTGLIAIAISSTVISVSWNASTDNSGLVQSGVANYVLRRNGSVIATQPTLTFSDTGKAPSTQYSYTIQAVDAAGNPSAQSASQSATTPASGGGNPSGSYTATHYVAPFASVPGAVNDSADLGATAWANAAVESTPTTLGTWKARATAGTKTRVEPGVITGLNTGNRFIPSFAPVNAGTELNPIILFARYPAATNRGSPSLFTEIRKPTPMTTVNGFSVPGSGVCPALGNLSGINYCIFDGFYANEAEARSAPNGGIFLGHAGTIVEFRRCVIDRGDGVLYYDAGFNGNPYYAESTINSKFLDCVSTGHVLRASIPPTIHQNNSSIELYNSTGFVVRNCELEDFGFGLFQKESRNGWSTEGTWEYNKLTVGKSGINVQQGTFVCRHNLIIGADDGVHGDGGPTADRPDQILTFTNNTIILNAAPFDSAANRCGFIFETGMAIRTSNCSKNIVYAKTGWSGNHWATQPGGSDAWTFADWTTLNENNYYREDGAALQFVDTSFLSHSGLAAWQSATGKEANSITTNPMFVDAENGNYRLQVGSPAAGWGCYVTGNEEIGVRANPTYT